MDPRSLPIRQYTNDIVKSVRNNPVTVVIGETGSGKTTQISQILLEAGFADGGCIGITQPRRVAAVMVARRVAHERNTELGQEVGYAVRFEDRTTRHTKIKYLTDGTLLRECLDDSSLSQYSVLVLDEAHERSVNTDILFALVKQLAVSREKPLKLVITSATLESEKFSHYFNNCPVFKVPGRTFPVDIIHSVEDHSRDYQAAVVDAVVDIHCHQPEGDILIFLTGQAEIDKTVKELNNVIRSLPPDSCGDMLVLPLYAALPPEMQARVFRSPPPGVRRCIVATNIAETSVTVDGVVYVIDPGVVKQKDYNPRTGMDTLSVVSISRVQATQRAGRAGRTRPGKCFRLYTSKKFQQEMESTTAPEIQRTSLVSIVLYLKSLPLNIDVLGFDYLDPPANDALEDALRQLYVLDAIDGDGKITAVGKKMTLLPLDPSLARALIAAKDLGCLEEMMTVAAMVSPESSVFVGGKGPEQLIHDSDTTTSNQRQQQQKYTTTTISQQGRALLKELMRDGLGDHVLLLRLYQAWQEARYNPEWCKGVGVDNRSMRFAKDVRQQLERIIHRDGSGLVDTGGGVGDRRDNNSENDDDGKDTEQEERAQKRQKQHTSTSTTEKHRHHNQQQITFTDTKTLTSLRMALTIGFSNRLARRMPLHNGYRTLGTSPALAQLHPSCAVITPDEDGLLPEWLIYHELISTGRTYLSKVCPVEGKWVDHILPKLQGVDVLRLSGGKTAAQAIADAERKLLLGSSTDGGKEGCGKDGVLGEKRNDEDAVAAARARYLARKASKGGGGRKK